MFERSLSQLIKGLRANAAPLSGATRQQQRNEARYVSQQLDEIRVEMRSEDRAVKAEAVLKLCYVSGAARCAPGHSCACDQRTFAVAANARAYVQRPKQLQHARSDEFPEAS